MRTIGDFHIHSRFSRACSKDLGLKNLEKFARLKGIDVLGTGDFQHPAWMRELRANLEEDGTGMLRPRRKEQKGRRRVGRVVFNNL